MNLQLDAWRTAPGGIVLDNADLFTADYGFTQQLRALHVRFSVRSREADRDLDVLGGGGAGNRDLYRMPLDLPGGGVRPGVRGHRI